MMKVVVNETIENARVVGYYENLRLSESAKAQKPNSYFYEVRHRGNSCEPEEIAKSVVIDFVGTLETAEPIKEIEHMAILGHDCEIIAPDWLKSLQHGLFPKHA
ncbi:LPD28 domain-containing protein [Kurthia sp. Dielmo]|uniref:LPD28 domain-containing protein n=1 Tax=Kurthia sp. Dielmo TaxID=1033738 RepID=UPI0011203E94|nr:LPD28 domain-containing protein [Kurthia sp. Dielmo]